MELEQIHILEQLCDTEPEQQGRSSARPNKSRWPQRALTESDQPCMSRGGATSTDPLSPACKLVSHAMPWKMQPGRSDAIEEPMTDHKRYESDQEADDQQQWPFNRDSETALQSGGGGRPPRREKNGWRCPLPGAEAGIKVKRGQTW